MTNDTNTLNGALQELGETMAANLTTQGVPSTYDEGLTTLAGKILDIVPGPGPTPTVASVGLSADKSILSYYDSESATLSATVLDSNDDPMEGVTVTFYNGSTSMGTADTNSSGVATKSYASAGSGDVSFTATVGTISSETYTLEDCTYYSTINYTSSSATLNIPLPSHFSLEYILKQGSTSSGVPYLDVGNASNDRMLVGQYARAGGNGLIVYKSTSTTHAYGTNPTANQENTIWFKYDGSKYYYRLNSGSTMEVADANVTLSKLIHIEAGGSSSNYIKNIKIKPL